MTATQETIPLLFPQTLEDGSYAGKICERFSPAGHHSEVYDAEDNKVMEFRRAVLGKGWATIKDGEGTLLARMEKGKDGHWRLLEPFADRLSDAWTDAWLQRLFTLRGDGFAPPNSDYYSYLYRNN